MSSFSRSMPARRLSPPLPRALSLSVLLACAGLGTTAGLPTLAQAQTPAQQPGFAVAPGPLEAALTQFGQQAGVLVSFSTTLTAGRTSPGVQGSQPVAVALAALLQGTGLEAVPLDGGYTLRLAPPAPAAGVSQLAPVSVVAQAERQGTTEGTGSYTGRAANTATGLTLSMRETPQSVSILTRQQMDDQGISSLEDALASVPGIVSNSGYYIGNSGAYVSRGMPVGQIQYDGQATSTGANGTFNADNGDMAIYDRVEVVRGATGLMQGTGQPSASINLIRKRPGSEPSLSLSGTLGSWKQRSVMVDGSTPVDEAGRVRVRGVLSYRGGDDFVDVMHRDTRLAYGILEWDLTPQTQLTLGGEWRRTHDGVVSGLPTRPDGSFYDFARSTYLGNDFNRWHQTSKNVFGELEHRFDSGWRAKVALAKYWTDVDMVFTTLAYRNSQYYQGIQAYEYTSHQTTGSVQASGPFSLLGREHELVVGASYRKRMNPVQQGGWIPNDQQALIPDLYDWNPGQVAMPAYINPTQWGIAAQETWESGVYAAARFSVTDALTVILGARNSKPSNFASVVTPYYGVVYDLNDTYTVYASRTQTHQPVSTVDIDGNTLKPVEGTNDEVGLKAEYFEGRLNASLALFQMRQRNRVMQDRNGPSPCPSNGATWCSVSAGEIKSRGYELELSGEVLPGWNVSAGYSYVSARYVNDNNAANIGEAVDTDSPKRQFKLATSYRLPGQWQRWTVGGAVYAQSQVYSGTIAQGGYGKLDLFAGYRVNQHLDLRVNVNNVFDRNYYQFIGWTTGGNYFGAPRQVVASANYRF